MVDNEKFQDYYFLKIKIINSKIYEKRVPLGKTQAQLVALTLTQHSVKEYFLL